MNISHALSCSPLHRTKNVLCGKVGPEHQLKASEESCLLFDVLCRILEQSSLFFSIQADLICGDPGIFPRDFNQ